MTIYRYAVKVRKVAPSVWRWYCPACGRWEAFSSIHVLITRVRVYRGATHHAATCADLHWANWDAACPSCRSFGKPAKACMTCLTRRPL